MRLQCLCCCDGPNLSWARAHCFSLCGLDLLNPQLGCTILKFSAYQNPLKELFKQSVPTLLPLPFVLIHFQAFAIQNYPKCLAFLCHNCACSVGLLQPCPGICGGLVSGCPTDGEIYGPLCSLCTNLHIKTIFWMSIGILSQFIPNRILNTSTQTCPLTSPSQERGG